MFLKHVFGRTLFLVHKHANPSRYSVMTIRQQRFSMSATISMPVHEQHSVDGDFRGVCDVIHLPVRPFDFLDDVADTVKDTVLILLNQDWVLLNDPSLGLYKRFEKLWERSAYKVCVDGGLKTLHHINDNLQTGPAGRFYLPDLVCGDFDSASPKLLEFYQNLGAKIEHTPDQDNTDFTKCLALIGQYLADNEIRNVEDIKHVVALSGVSDRFDHSLSNIDTIFTSHKHLPSSVKLYVLSEDTCTTVLQKGTTKVGMNERWRGGWCSLLPVGRPTSVYTKGLGFDLSGCMLQTGKQMMRYNRSSESRESFTVTTDQNIVISMEVLS